ncbi:hypothetical protein [Lysinibacillus fusiformis]|uniref:hemoblobin-interacting domain-containing protein n=1 Tax=Lysinibacillus fusiformis TaxID=28031 RepID=UPI0011A53AEB|nr:hypothetical protein [Lysinibacillus fusiformis]
MVPLTIGSNSSNIYQVVNNTPFVFSFNDDIAWRAAFTSLTYTHSSTGLHVQDVTSTVSITSGQLVASGHKFMRDGTWIITIKAMGYPDTIVTVISGP